MSTDPGTVLLDLDDPRCGRVEVAGGKGAGLSRARSAGLPVLPGAVLPTTAAAASMRAGASALGVRGSGAARRAVMAERLPDGVRRELEALVGRLGGDVIVRSSANVESSGEWAGAFSSFSEIGVAEIDVAVRGCWASAFGVDVVERSDHVGHGPDGLTMSVLIQPRIEPTVSGLARAGAEDSVVVEVVSGSPAALMSGWASGQRITVDRGSVVRSPDAPLLDDRQAIAVAGLLRQAFRILGHSIIEWAMADGELVLLQSMAAPRPVITAEVAERRAGLAALHHPHADRVVRWALAFPGGLSEELVLPWGLGLVDPDALDTTTPSAGAELDLAWARDEVRTLAHQVWGGDEADVLGRSRDAMRALRGDTPRAALDALGTLGEPDLARAQLLVTHLLRAGRTMTERRRLRRPEEIFGCEVHEVVHATGPLRQSWAGARRWEPFLAGVGEAQGTTFEGVPASPGLGAGQVLGVPALDEAVPTRVPRAVIVAPFPVPALASLLWDAAGLVTVGGSAGAHLIEVARSLGVPAVVACEELPPTAELGGLLAVVDGDAGVVSLHRSADPVGAVSSPAGAARATSARPGGR